MLGISPSQSVPIGESEFTQQHVLLYKPWTRFTDNGAEWFKLHFLIAMKPFFVRRNQPEKGRAGSVVKSLA